MPLSLSRMQTLSAAGIQTHDYVGIQLEAEEMYSFEINTWEIIWWMC